MRHYMDKVILEPAKYGSVNCHKMGNECRKAKKFKLDEDLDVSDNYCRTILPMRHRSSRWWNEKEYALSWSVVKRFVESKVGKRWDDVYSEICKNLKSSAAERFNVKDMFKDRVELDTFIDPEDGLIYYRSRYEVSRIDDGMLYVHPVTGILCKSQSKGSYKYRWKKDKEKREVEKLAHRRIITSDFQFHKVNGVWYRVWLEDLPVNEYLQSYDALGVFENVRPFCDNYTIKLRCKEKYGAWKWAVKKQTASKSDIRTYGLNK